MDSVMRNLRQSLRALARTPAFSIAIALTLAFGIGANAAVFSIVDAVLLKPLPIHEGERLLEIAQYEEQSRRTHIAPVRVADWDRLNHSFEAIAGYYTEDVADTHGELPERLKRAKVTPRFLDVWGASPALGRGFTAADHRFGSRRAVIVSDRYWRTRMNRDPQILNRTIRLDDQSFAIVGIMSPSFTFPDREVDWWFPEYVDAPYTQSRDSGWFAGVVGRLKPTVTAERARVDLAIVQSQLGAQYPQTDGKLSIQVMPYKDTVVGRISHSLWLLFGAVLVLLLIACVNIGSLLLSRAAQREQDITVRFWLGASRFAVAMQSLAESAVLAGVGAIGGIAVAGGLTAAFRLAVPDVPRVDEIQLDARIVLYMTATVLAVTLLCGLFPALRTASVDPASSRSAQSRFFARHRAQWILVGVQIALSVTLMSGAGLLLRSFEKLSRVDAGFDAAQALTFRISGSFAETRNMERVMQRIRATLEELHALPGVESAATAFSLPGVANSIQSEFKLAAGRADTDPRMMAESRFVSPDYFQTLSIPLLAGEMCRRSGTDASPGVLVNRSFVDRYLQGRSVVGLQLAGNAPQTIVGIVGDARENGIERDPAPTVYSCAESPNPVPWFLLRTHGDPMALATAVRMKLKQLEPLRSVYDIAVLQTRLSDAQAGNRLRMAVLTLFAAAALLLSCLGIYGTLSYLVNVRRREVGLCMALGARPRDILSRFVLEAGRVVGLACAIGLALSFGLNRMLSGMLYGVSPSDPATLAAVIGIVATVALTAALLPALRAARIDPMAALRQ